MFQLARYFFILFVTVTVLPLAGLLLWSQINISKHEYVRHAQALDIGAENMAQLYQHHLNNNVDSMQQTLNHTSSLPYRKEDILALLGGQAIWWSDDAELPKGLSSFALSPIRTKPGQVMGSYAVIQTNENASQMVVTAYRVTLPFGSAHPAVILTKPVPLDDLIPHGPFLTTLYVGDTIRPEHKLKSIMDPHIRQQAWEATHPGPLEDHFGSPNRPEVAPPNGPRPNNPPPPGQEPPILPPQLQSPQTSFSIQLVPTATKRLAIPSFNGQPALTIVMSFVGKTKSETVDEISRWIGMIILMAGVVSSFIAAHFLRSRFIDPLLNLASATQTVRQGDLSVRIDTSTLRQGEVKDTLDSFNQMIANLEEQQELRDNFITNLTHDFRTPLVAQNRSLEMLTEEFEALNLEKQAKLAKTLSKSNEHLLGMVNQLLETYKFEQGKLELEPKPLLIPDIVKQCCDQLHSLATQREIAIDTVFDTNFPTVEADESCMKRVFINLIGNALENIPKGSHIMVSGRPHTDRIELHVHDNGQGIPEEICKRLFDRYFAGSETKKLGSGLGLYICKMFVEAHGGQITVESFHNGNGSKGQNGSSKTEASPNGSKNTYTDFKIVLPLKPAKEVS